MLTLRGLYEEGKIQLLDAPPQGARSLVAVVFPDGMQDQIADAQETMLLAKIAHLQASGQARVS